ncbi:MAG: hypothetical protein J6N49_04765 [Alphaproteobacteria bacterium]|nr:hypothetical protein [Alphaproteobacteria bacterium]
MAEAKKITLGQKFLEALQAASKSKEQLLQLADIAIKMSPSHRTLADRKLPDDITAVKMCAAPAEFNARRGKDLSTDGMLLIIMTAYSKHPKGSPKNFKEDFKKAYPAEYGVEKTQKKDFSLLKGIVPRSGNYTL